MKDSQTVTFAALNFSPEKTGIGPYVGSLSHGLSDRGMDVTVQTAAPHYPEWRIHDGYGQWRSSTRDHGVAVIRRRHHVPRTRSTLDRLLSEVTFGLRLLPARITGDALVVVSPALFSSLMLVLRVRLTSRRRTVAWIQDLYGAGLAETAGKQGFVTRLLWRIESYFLRSVDDVVVIHDRFRELVIAAGVSPENVHVIPNWSHVAPREIDADVDSSRGEFGWEPDEVIVLHAGNQGIKQGLDNVVEAARIADARTAGVRFVLLGDGNSRRELEQRSAGLRRIQFIDPLDDDAFARALTAADVLLVNELPGVREMCVPSKLTTYFSTGKPVLAATADESLTAMEIEKSGGGVTVAAGDPQALLDAALDLAADPERSRQLGQAGLTYRASVLSMHGAIDAWRQVLARS